MDSFNRWVFIFGGVAVLFLIWSGRRERRQAGGGQLGPDLKAEYERRLQEKLAADRANPRWFSCVAPFDETPFEWRVDFETMTLLLGSLEAVEFRDVVTTLQLNRTPTGWQMQITGEPNIEFTKVIERRHVASESSAPLSTTFVVPSEVEAQLDERHARYLASRAAPSR